MSASATVEVMPVSAIESPRLSVGKSATSMSSVKLFKSLQADSATKSEAAGYNSARVDTQRSLQPARKKLTTLEAQRVMAVLTTAIRRVELASVLPQLVAERRTDLDLGEDLAGRLTKHGVLLGSIDDVKEDTVEQQLRTNSSNSVRSNQSCGSALSQHSASNNLDATPTASEPDDQQVISPISVTGISTRSSITLCAIYE